MNHQSSKKFIVSSIFLLLLFSAALFSLYSDRLDIQKLFGREVKAQADITTGLVGHWKFDEGAGTTANDSSGNNNTGTLSGAVWTIQGRFGQALVFDGINDWVTINDAPSLDLTTGMTIEAWVYPTAHGAGTWRNVLIKERAGGVTP